MRFAAYLIMSEASSNPLGHHEMESIPALSFILWNLIIDP